MPDGAVMIGGAQAPTGPVWMAWNFPERCIGELCGARLAHRLGISVPPWAGGGGWLARVGQPDARQHGAGAAVD